MRLILPLFLFGMLVTSCIDNNYDLSEIDTDGVVIGDEFRLPLATVTVSMSELSKEGTDIKALFDEADIWLPSPLPAGGKYVDLQKIQHTPSYIDELLDELIEQMKRSDAKINAVADLLYDKYLGTFLPLLPPNTDPKDFKQVFITMFRTTTGLQEELAGEVRDLAGSYLTDLKIEDVTYDLGRIDLGSDVVDMLADNLDPKGTQIPKTRWTSTAKSSAHCLSACSSAPDSTPRRWSSTYASKRPRSAKRGSTRTTCARSSTARRSSSPSNWRNISPAPDSRPTRKSSSHCVLSSAAV